MTEEAICDHELYEDALKAMHLGQASAETGQKTGFIDGLFGYESVLERKVFLKSV